MMTKIVAKKINDEYERKLLLLLESKLSGIELVCKQIDMQRFDEAIDKINSESYIHNKTIELKYKKQNTISDLMNLYDDIATKAESELTTVAKKYNSSIVLFNIDNYFDSIRIDAYFYKKN